MGHGIMIGDGLYITNKQSMIEKKHVATRILLQAAMLISFSQIVGTLLGLPDSLSLRGAYLKHYSSGAR